MAAYCGRLNHAAPHSLVSTIHIKDMYCQSINRLDEESPGLSSIVSPLPSPFHSDSSSPRLAFELRSGGCVLLAGSWNVYVDYRP